jgi:hypothetical protein
MAYNQQSGSDRKLYSKLTAQIAKNTVRKHVAAIKKGGARAADELIDQFIGTTAENQRKTRNSKELSAFQSKFIPVIERNRGKWRNFIIELAGRFDIDSLSTVGVGIIYGGIMTASVGNAGWASELIIDNKSGEPDAERTKKASDLISLGRNRGGMVWIVRGKGTYSPEMLRVYRYYPECTFFLIEEREDRSRSFENTDKKELFGAKNIIFVLSGADQAEYTLIASMGIPYVVDPSLKGNTSRASGAQLSVGREYEGEIMRFFESPSFPLTINRISEAANIVENLLSEGKSRQIPRYTV